MNAFSELMRNAGMALMDFWISSDILVWRCKKPDGVHSTYVTVNVAIYVRNSCHQDKIKPCKNNISEHHRSIGTRLCGKNSKYPSVKKFTNGTLRFHRFAHVISANSASEKILELWLT